MKLKNAIYEIKNILKNRPNYVFETNLIFQHILKKSTEQLLITNEINIEKFKKIKTIAHKLNLNYPIQHLLSSWQFYGLEITLNNKVFIPRPETEQLVDIALQLKNKKTKIIDLCTGSGCISLAIAKNNKDAKIKAIDLSNYAIKCAKKNTLKFKNQIQIIKGNIFNANLIKNFSNWADLIICNPPYLNKNDMLHLQAELKHEPKMALYGGKDGLIFYKKICRLWTYALKNSGWFAFEIGNTQKLQVESILKKNNLTKIQTFKDYFKNDRITIAQKLN